MFSYKTHVYSPVCQLPTRIFRCHRIKCCSVKSAYAPTLEMEMAQSNSFHTHFDSTSCTSVRVIKYLVVVGDDDGGGNAWAVVLGDTGDGCVNKSNDNDANITNSCIIIICAVIRKLSRSITCG